MNEVLPGVWHWTAVHPRIKQQVHSHWLADARVVLDPMVPPEGLPAFDPSPERVVLTNRHHLRDAERFVEEVRRRSRAGEFSKVGTRMNDGDRLAATL